VAKRTYERQVKAHGNATLTTKLDVYGEAAYKCFATRDEAHSH